MVIDSLKGWRVFLLDPFLPLHFPDRKIKRLPGIRSLSHRLIRWTKNKILQFFVDYSNYCCFLSV